MRYKKDLMDYLPGYHHDVRELRLLMDTENVELDSLGDAIDRIYDNQFIDSLDIFGVKRFEKLLNLRPDVNESIEDRRSRIWSVFLTVPPFTRWFFEIYYNSILGQGNWRHEVFVSEFLYLFFVRYSRKNLEKVVIEFLERTLPMHIVFDVALFESCDMLGYVGFLSEKFGSVTTKMVR